MLTNKKRNRSRLWMYFTLIILATVIMGFLMVTLVWWLLYKTNLITVVYIQRKFPLFAVVIGSAIIGVIIALFVGKLFIKPIENISNAINELSKGNFDVRVSEKERIKEIGQMYQSFNEMAYALSQVETLQNDFVTNVSHEFKTPIASIEGYATLLQDDSLPEATRERYLAKILYNSHKLSDLSENILLLSKIENQPGQLNKKSFRLDEQIQKHIFDKFYQGDKSRTAEGNGLGLALVKRIVEICCGEVRVKSEIDEGAEFTVILPKAQ